jgi:hypothetical protein
LIDIGDTRQLPSSVRSDESQVTSRKLFEALVDETPSQLELAAILCPTTLKRIVHGAGSDDDDENLQLSC